MIHINIQYCVVLNIKQIYLNAVVHPKVYYYHEQRALQNKHERSFWNSLYPRLVKLPDETCTVRAIRSNKNNNRQISMNSFELRCASTQLPTGYYIIFDHLIFMHYI